jgi:hypothetical protein
MRCGELVLWWGLRKREGSPLRTKKVRAIPAPEDVPVIFSDERVRQLAAEAKLPLDTADLPRFAAAIRVAAETYIRDASIPSDNAVHREIKALYNAAARRRHAEVAERIDALSKRTRDFINKRAALPSIPWKIPAAAALRNEAKRDDACAAIASLLRIGGRWKQGRRRPSGRRSISFVPELYAPTLRKHLPKRKAERDFVMWLQLAYLNATEQSPPHTAHHVNRGPFARMVKACLQLVGAQAADAVELINGLQRDRRRMRKRQLL